MDGPSFPGFGWGFHALFVLGFAAFWIVVVAGLLLALYFVIRTAVTNGILRADAARGRGAPGMTADELHRHRPSPRGDEPPPATPPATPPDVAA